MPIASASRPRRPRWPLLLTFLMSALPGQAAPPPDKVALTNVRIIPVVGATIERGTVLVERGKIAAVGAEVTIPYDARVFDFPGRTVFPGCINVHTARGLDRPNEARPVVPQLDVYDALDPSQLFFEDCLRIGVTVVNVMPGNDTVIAGLGRVVRPIGLSVDEMTLAADAFAKLAVSPRSGSDRMVQLAMLREAFLSLEAYQEQVAEERYEASLKEANKLIDVGPAEARRRGMPLVRAEDINEENRNLLRLTGGVLRVAGQEGPTLFQPLGAFVWCQAAMDIGAALRVAREFGFEDRLVLVVGTESFKALEELKKAARPVVLPADLVHREIDPLTGEVRETELARRFFDARLLVALTPGSDDSLAERMPTYQAARAIRQGVARDEALRAITLNPARILGLESRLGSIEPGKDAHLVVWSGDPLEFTSVVEHVFIDGIPAYDRTKDVRLKRLLELNRDAQPDTPAASSTAPAAGEPAAPPAEPPAQPDPSPETEPSEDPDLDRDHDSDHDQDHAREHEGRR